ncbi:hypothetical protein ACHAWF_015953 [Thalassiosira exigua]
MPSGSVLLRALFAASVASSPWLPPASAKIDAGKVHLTGAKTESTLVKFAVSASGAAKFDVNFTTYGMYEDEQALRLRVYVDEEWPMVQREPLCSEKVKFGQRQYPIVFDFQEKRPDDRPGKKRGDTVDVYAARVKDAIPNPPNPRSKFGQKKKDRSRYFYFAVDDCSLERSYHDGKIPDMSYAMSVENGRPSPTGEMAYDHLPSDEDGIRFLMALTILFSGFLSLLLFYRLARTMGGEVHVAVFVVMAACLANALSATCELVHMSAFSYNGYGNYALDALSGHFEAVSDSMVSLILLSIGGGWTLPTDVVGGGMSGGSPGNKLMKGVRNPAGSLLGLFSRGGGAGDKQAGAVALTIVLVHSGLAQWGRTFDDSFDTYHALEHPPGRALMFLRFVLGLIFVTGVGMVRSGGRCPPSLMSFLTKFGLVGLSYFASLPGVSMFVGSVLPFHQRHQALHWGASMVQACSLASLTWLFIGGADASAYHRLSRVGKHIGEGDMTESIAASRSAGPRGPTMWRLGKTKIRLD